MMPPGGRKRTRTLDPLIEIQLLYQLSPPATRKIEPERVLLQRPSSQSSALDPKRHTSTPTKLGHCRLVEYHHLGDEGLDVSSVRKAAT
jgi:hypothetical protein